MRPEERATLPKVIEVLKCPYCGHLPDVINDIEDVIYPVSRERSAWYFQCSEGQGGCGAEVIGDSPLDALNRWNTRVS